MTKFEEILALVDAMTALAKESAKKMDDPKLSDEAFQALRQSVKDIRRKAADLLTDAAVLAASNVGTDLTAIRQATEAASNVVKNIKKVGALIEVVADVVVIAGALYSGKPKLAVDALDELKKDIQPFTT